MRTVDNQERLYVGSFEDYEQLNPKEMDVIVNLSSKCDASYTMERSYFHFPLRDDHNSKYRDFKEVCTAVIRRYEDYDDEDILVHCDVGQSRSVCVVAAALTVIENEQYETALDKVSTEVPPFSLLQEYGEQFSREVQ